MNKRELSSQNLTYVYILESKFHENKHMQLPLSLHFLNFILTTVVTCVKINFVFSILHPGIEYLPHLMRSNQAGLFVCTHAFTA